MPLLVLGCSLPFVSPEPEPTFPARPVISVPVSPRPFPTRPVPTPSPTVAPAPATATPPPATLDLVTIIPTPRSGVTEEWKQAVKLFQVGNAMQFQGVLDEAVRAYQDSIYTYPTAEAYTFLGWTLSWMDQYEMAIDQAKRAVELDPDYGNPYNDIGSYLIQLGRLDEAIPWLEKAMEARRYATPHFPHLNLVDIWVQKGLWQQALNACEQALLLAPDQPLPPFPTRVIGVTEPFEMGIDPSRVAEVPAVEAAITAYLDAWSRHDPVAVIGMSALGSHEAAKAVMLQLAEAKIRGLAPRVEDLRVVHLSGDEAIVELSVENGPLFGKHSYLLKFVEEGWKVGPVLIDLSPEAQPEPPFN